MTKELQDLIWSVLPKEFKGEVKKIFNKYIYGYSVVCSELINIFGIDNLTSDAEGEEMLMVPRSKVIEIYNPEYDGDTLYELFGSKCLPDEGYTTCVHASGTACKHYNHKEHHCSLHGECKFEPSLEIISTEVGNIDSNVDGDQNKNCDNPKKGNDIQNIFNIGDHDAFVLHYALLQLERSSKAVREALKKIVEK